MDQINTRGSEIIRTVEEIANKWYFSEECEYSIKEIIEWLTGKETQQ